MLKQGIPRLCLTGTREVLQQRGRGVLNRNTGTVVNESCHDRAGGGYVELSLSRNSTSDRG